ncbi:flagellar hook assembly protein FlgD [Cytobacillus sp. FJAT-54145]|uniref:Basal-body rod modification protein FlgD n=1 Tax=Cytobacillus spartinae TaxID=3299023 RepID=A0ABW6K4J8_9BACI
MTNTIDSSLYLSNYQKQQRNTGSDVLGKDDFLKILMTQLQHQDPLNPMQDKDFIAQMATFTSLEQITNMGKSIDKFVQSQEDSKLISYSQFVGKEITWHKLQYSEEDPDAEPVVQEGISRVISLQFKDGNVYFKLEDGTELEPANISQINSSPTENNLIQASMLIGKSITYFNENKEEKQSVVKSVSFKDGKTLFQLDDETSITSSQITKIG